MEKPIKYRFEDKRTMILYIGIALYTMVMAYAMSTQDHLRGKSLLGLLGFCMAQVLSVLMDMGYLKGLKKLPIMVLLTSLSFTSFYHMTQVGKDKKVIYASTKKERTKKESKPTNTQEVY